MISNRISDRVAPVQSIDCPPWCDTGVTTNNVSHAQRIQFSGAKHEWPLFSSPAANAFLVSCRITLLVNIHNMCLNLVLQCVLIL